VNFQVGDRTDFAHVEARLGEAFQRVERAALQQFRHGTFKRDFEARMRAVARKHALVFRVHQGHIDDGVTSAERRILDQNAEAGLAQSGDAGLDVREAGDNFVRHFRQTKSFADDAVLDVTLENLGKGLAACFPHRVAGCHAVADVEVADDIDRNIGLGAVTQTGVGQGADAARHIAGVQVDQHFAIDLAVRVVKSMQFRIEQFGRPPAVSRWREPALLRIVHERTVGARLAQVKVGPEIVGAEALEELAVGTGARSQFSCAFAVRKQHRAFIVFHVSRPDAVDFMQQGGLIEFETTRSQLLLHGFNGRFEGGVFSGDKAFDFDTDF
jgi:hypothetical protein